MSFFMALFYVLSRTKAFQARADTPPARTWVLRWLFFTFITITGSYLGIDLPDGVIANTRALGAIVSGFVGGPLLGLAVGVTAGFHRLSLGGTTAVAGAVATTAEGLIGGLIHLWLVRREGPGRLPGWQLAAGVTACAEVLHMGFVLALSPHNPDPWAVVKTIGPPMIMANAIGAALFALVMRDRQRERDQVAADSSARALRVAQRTLGLLARGFDPAVAPEVARIIREETGAGAVVITDATAVLAFDGLGADHHRAPGPIVSTFTRRAIDTGEVVFADGVTEHYNCPISADCPLDSVLVSPLALDGVVVGTVQLFEPRHRRFSSVNRSLGEGLAALLSSQLVAARYEQAKGLLTQQELKLIQAQVNPHFLFNALNTVAAVLRADPARARDLLLHLAAFFRKNLKRPADLATLRDELEHVGAYLEIEKARFADRLTVETEIDPSLLDLKLPAFTLQPLVENAFKHGFANTLGPGTARIRARREAQHALIEIEDDAGAYVEPVAGDGLGLRSVDRRIKTLLGREYGVAVSCVPGVLTRVTVRVPAQGVTP
ncbi:MAG: sensor histidine kinase [Anaeromyxobacter sp.]|nr:sensor histidine kinase [Anaeromyxobacter sp.]MBL0274650.1 sensor histidine kinase [Anaeromyxobacter sp.]